VSEAVLAWEIRGSCFLKRILFIIEVRLLNNIFLHCTFEDLEGQ